MSFSKALLDMSITTKEAMSPTKNPALLRN